MDISVTSAIKQVGETFPFSATAVFPAQEYGGREIAFDSPFIVEGTFLWDGSTVSLRANVRVKLLSVCARCGEVFSEDVSFPMEETFVKNKGEEDDSDTYPFYGDVLHLDDALLDNLFLSLPIVSICNPDCKGICPVCGTNRNLSDCGCLIQDLNNPFSVLQSTIRNDD